MGRQTKQVKQAQREAQRAEAFIANATTDAVKRTRKAKPETLCTAEDIVRERDERGHSWAQVAANLGLGSPGAARSAYTKLTGKPHNESNPELRRAGKNTKSASGARRKIQGVLWDDDTDQDEIIAALTHHDVLVQRTVRGMELPDEWVHVCRIARFTFDGPDEELVAHVFTKEQCECRLKDPRDADTGVARAFRVRDMKELL